MAELQINGKPVQAPEGMRLLDLVRREGYTVPAMCYQEGLPHFTSCMVCVVADAFSGKMLPACTALAENGMQIETDSAAVRGSRRQAVSLLLDDHRGDCEGPCRNGCPAGMDIPAMIRAINARRFNEAIRIVYEHIPLPAILGRICPAPCEKVCRREGQDEALAICLLKRFTADYNNTADQPYIPTAGEATGKKITIIGAGPAGLTAAFYLRRLGHTCVCLEQGTVPGGSLLEVPTEKLSKDIREKEINQILEMGVELRCNVQAGRDIPLDDIRKDSDAVIVAGGNETAIGIDCKQADRETGRIGQKDIFAAGSCIRNRRTAIAAMRDGRAAAFGTDAFLRSAQPAARRFNSRMGRMSEAEAAYLAAHGSKDTRIQPTAEALSEAEAVQESKRCMHCDCRAKDDCTLRRLAEQTQAVQKKQPGRQPVHSIINDHPVMVFEPGKCINCGLCVRITRQADEPIGLAFSGRGLDTGITVPFNRPLSEGVQKSAADCIQACPTGALAFRNNNHD